MICFNLFQLPRIWQISKYLKFSPNPAKVELQWRNFYDPESTIRQYDVQVQRAPYVYFLFLIFTSVQYQTSQKMNILIFAKFLVIKIN
jgi:hypothetical protein